MELQINKPDIISLEMKCISIFHKLDKNDIEGAKNILEDLRAMIVEQKQLQSSYKELFFQIANKF